MSTPGLASRWKYNPERGIENESNCRLNGQFVGKGSRALFVFRWVRVFSKEIEIWGNDPGGFPVSGLNGR